MSIPFTSIFSPSAGVSAANKGYAAMAQGLQQGRTSLKNKTKQANASLQTNTDLANTALNTGADKGYSYINSGTDKAAGSYTNAADLYKGLQNTDQSGRDMYYNSLGLNGAGGNEAAVGAFQHGPGYQFALDQANQNVMRNQGATGALNSGGTLQALSDRAQGLQNQEYGNWQNQLSGINEHYYGDVAGQANQLDQLGGLFENAGQNNANIATGTAGRLSGNLTNLGQGLSGNQMALGNNLAGNSQAMGQAGYQRQQDIFGAKQSANANLWGGVLGLGQGLLGAAGSAGGFGKLFG